MSEIPSFSIQTSQNSFEHVISLLSDFLLLTLLYRVVVGDFIDIK